MKPPAKFRPSGKRPKKNAGKSRGGSTHCFVAGSTSRTARSGDSRGRRSDSERCRFRSFQSGDRGREPGHEIEGNGEQSGFSQQAPREVSAPAVPAEKNSAIAAATHLQHSLKTRRRVSQRHSHPKWKSQCEAGLGSADNRGPETTEKPEAEANGACRVSKTPKAEAPQTVLPLSEPIKTSGTVMPAAVPKVSLKVAPEVEASRPDPIDPVPGPAVVSNSDSGAVPKKKPEEVRPKTLETQVAALPPTERVRPAPAIDDTRAAKPAAPDTAAASVAKSETIMAAAEPRAPEPAQAESPVAIPNGRPTSTRDPTSVAFPQEKRAKAEIASPNKETGKSELPQPPAPEKEQRRTDSVTIIARSDIKPNTPVETPLAKTMALKPSEATAIASLPGPAARASAQNVPDPAVNNDRSRESTDRESAPSWTLRRNPKRDSSHRNPSRRTL